MERIQIKVTLQADRLCAQEKLAGKWPQITKVDTESFYGCNFEGTSSSQTSIVAVGVGQRADCPRVTLQACHISGNAVTMTYIGATGGNFIFLRHLDANFVQK